MMEPVTVGDSIDIVMKWARRMMGDWIIYEEPEIDGVQKAVDPSFQYLGDLLYKTLYEVGASLRLEYVFESNAFVLSVYRGKGQDAGADGATPGRSFSDTWGTLTGYKASRGHVALPRTRATSCTTTTSRTASTRTGGRTRGSSTRWTTSSRCPLCTESSTRRTEATTRSTVGDESEPAIETYLDLRDEKPSCDGGLEPRRRRAARRLGV